MKKGSLISILAVLLVLAACVCTVSAEKLTVTSLTLAQVNDRGDINLYLDSAPNGLAGYNITFTISDDTLAKIVDVKYPDWSVPDFRLSSTGANNVFIQVADVEETSELSGAPMYLGSVTVQGFRAGTTTISVIVDQIDDNDGQSIIPTVVEGSITVQGLPGAIQVNSTPNKAIIFIDGFLQTGYLTNTTIPNIAPGLHTVKVNRTLYVEAEQQVTVVSGQTVPVTFTLVRTGNITIESVPNEANIFFNGTDTEKVTNTTITGLAPGTITVKVTKAAYYSKSSKKTIVSGKTIKVAFTLNPATNDVGVPDISPYGNITVNSTPPGATVYINGKNAEFETLGMTEIYPGDYDVTVKLDGYLTPPAQKVTVIQHLQTSADFTLQPVPKPSLTCLWPSNNKYVDMTLTPINGPDGNPMKLTVTKITSDEATASEKGSGGAKNAPDATIRGGAAFQLRAERSGTGNGRMYNVSFTADNGMPGGVSTGAVTVCVPHDNSNKGDTCSCIDDGQKYDATTIN